MTGSKTRSPELQGSCSPLDSSIFLHSVPVQLLFSSILSNIRVPVSTTYNRFPSLSAVSQHNKTAYRSSFAVEIIAKPVFTLRHVTRLSCPPTQPAPF